MAKVKCIRKCVSGGSGNLWSRRSHRQRAVRKDEGKESLLSQLVTIGKMDVDMNVEVGAGGGIGNDGVHISHIYVYGAR